MRPMTAGRLASNHRRRMRTLKKEIEALSAMWDNWDGGVQMSYDALYNAVDDVIKDLDYVQFEKYQNVSNE